MKLTNMNESLIWLEIPDIVETQVRKEKGMIIGGKAVQAQLGLFSRPSYDFDVFSLNPKQSARRLEKKLDRRSGENLFYHKPISEHPSTIKVLYIGDDHKQNTYDDQTVADFTPFRPTRETKINGTRYMHIDSIVKEKEAILREKRYSFRHSKDRGDINLIRQVTSLQRKRG